MKYLSVCSGIEAATVAWHPIGWKPVAFSEIEPFPCKVLAHHYPTVPNHGDMTKFKEWPDYEPDLLVGGTPCQSFSIAGLRKGLDDPRGNLMLTYLAIAAKYRPKWLLWENVPGVLSSNEGRDFGTFLQGLVQCGYGFAYRVLDTQYCRTDGYPYAIPQRRRRVFVVGCLGDWRSAAAVLFDSESLCWNPPPSRKARESVARTTEKGTCSGKSTFGTLTATCGQKQWLGNQEALSGDYHVFALAGNTTIGRKPENGGNGTGFDDTGAGYTLTKTDVHAVAYKNDSLYNKGFTQGADHGSTQKTYAGDLLSRVQKEIGAKAFAEWGLGILDSLQEKEILRQALHGQELRQTAFSRSWVVCCALGSPFSCSEGAMQSLRETCGEGCSSQGWESLKQLSGKLGTYLSGLSQPGAQAERFMQDLWETDEGIGVLRKTLSAIQEIRRPAYEQSKSAHSNMQVRRLTVGECTFLQGFPRNYLSQVPGASDTQMYKALGNSMSVNVMQVIGERIKIVDKIK